MNRKQRRTMDKQLGKDSTKELSDRVTQFQNLPDMCLTCEKSFDKKSKKMVKTWNVVVKDEDTIRLYCPECWTMAHKLINEFKKDRGNVSK